MANAGFRRGVKLQGSRGVAFGVGAEYAITRNVILRAELLRYQFGDVTYSWTYPYASQSISASNNMLRIGGSLHF